MKLEELKISNKFNVMALRYILIVAIFILFLIALNIVLVMIVNNSNINQNATIMARNIIRMGDRSRTVIDKVWNLDSISNKEFYLNKYGKPPVELIPILISIDNINETINNLNFDPQNRKLAGQKIEFNALMNNSINPIFKEPNNRESKIINHIKENGYGDYKIMYKGSLEFYRPIIINHNRLNQKFLVKKGDVIGFYKLTFPKKVLESLQTYDYRISIIFNVLAIILISLFFYYSTRKKSKQLRKIDDVLNEMSKGDFTDEIYTQTHDEIDSIAIHINRISYNIRNMGQQLNSVIEYVQESSEKFHQFSSELSNSSKKQSIQIQDINNSIANLTSEIIHSTTYASDVNNKSHNSLKTAEVSNRFVNEVINDMVDLAKSTRKIEDILRIIKEIAFQTNLLAHNASIEAARAGEHGKGFSVVAQSVSELAKKSAESTKEIEELIKNSINELDKGTQKVTNMGENFDTIRNQLDEIASLIDGINKILRQQSEESYNVKDAINRINKISQETSRKAIFMEENIEELKSKTQALKEILDKNKFNRPAEDTSTKYDGNTKKITLRK